MLNRRNLVFIACGLVSGFFVLFSTSKYGLGTIPDSVGYIEIAQGFCEGKVSLSDWPPFFPLVLASLIKLKLPIALVRYLHALAVAILVIACGLELKRNSENWLIASIVALTIGLSRPVIGTASYILSDTLFILLGFLAIVYARRYLENEKPANLVLSTLATALAWLTRYIGIALLIAIALSFIFRFGRRGIYKAIVFSIFVSIPMAIWNLYNLMHYQAIASIQGEPPYGFLKNLRFIISVFLRAFLWVNQPRLVRYATFLVLSTLILAGGLLIYRRKRAFAPEFVWILALVVYLITLTVLASVRVFDLNERMLMPAFVLAVVSAGISFSEVYSVLLKRGRFLIAMFFGLFSLEVIFLGITTAHEKHKFGAGGAASVTWQSSKTLEFLKAHPEIQPIFSNEPWVIRYLTGKKAEISPPKYYHGSMTPVKDGTKRLQLAINNHNRAYLVWFKAVGASDNLMDISELRKLFKLEKLWELDDSVIYEVKSTENYIPENEPPSP